MVGASVFASGICLQETPKQKRYFCVFLVAHDLSAKMSEKTENWMALVCWQGHSIFKLSESRRTRRTRIFVFRYAKIIREFSCFPENWMALSLLKTHLTSKKEMWYTHAGQDNTRDTPSMGWFSLKDTRYPDPSQLLFMKHPQLNIKLKSETISTIQFSVFRCFFGESAIRRLLLPWCAGIRKSFL